MNTDMREAVHQEEQQEFQYYAFISYSHKDMKWARWLQKELESYKLPSKLQERESEKNKKSPNPIQPVFRDETSINPGKSVDDALKSELEKSKYLIVICSPASSASTWVDREVERFVEMGREDRIMPFIVDGVPHSPDAEKECYVPALRTLADKKGSSILGADVQARGKREAFLCTVAFLLGIDLETLRSREAERRRRKRIAILSASAAIVALCVFFGIKAWNYYVPKVSYYQDYTIRFGLPEGLGQLTEQQIKTREEHFEITSQYGRIQSLVHKNQYDTITDIPDSERWDYPARIEFSYDDGGNLISSTRYRANGKPFVTWKYTDHLRVVQFEYPEQVGAESDDLDNTGSVALTLAADTQNMETDAYESNTNRSFIAGYMIKYGDDGLIRDLYYSDMPSFGRKVKDANGIWGLRYEYDAEGHITRIQYLNENGELMTARTGIAQKTYAYDQGGQRVRVEYQDENGDLVKNSEGWAIDIQEFENGNIVAEETRDENGELVINNAGWARIDVVYDQYGNAVEMSITGVNGEPIIDSSGWNKETYTYDEQGRETERKGYDLDGNPAICSAGYASCRSSYDEKGNFVEMICYDERGNVAVCYDGFASWKAVYDDRGELIERRYFDETGEPTLIQNGYTTIRWAYDEHGNITEFSYFGTNDEPILGVDGFASKKVQYDARGNETEEAFYDPEGNLVDCYYGFAKITYRYDNQGNVTETAYYGENGDPVLIGRGYASERHQYDDKGNMIETSYYGTSGQLKIVVGGYAGWTSKYDDYGNEIEVCFFDTDKKPVVCKDGYAIRQTKYDAVNNPIETIYLDAERNPVEIGEVADDSTSTLDYTTQSDQGMLQYPVAYTDSCISLSADWVFADRSIEDDSVFCTAWGLTSKEFVDEYLAYDHFAFALDTLTGTGMYFDVSETDLEDYSRISEAEISDLGVEMAEWLEDVGEEVLSNETVELKVPYCKVTTRSEEMTYYYYETVVAKNRITFMFMIGTDEWDPSYEKKYDEIVENAVLVPGI